MITKEISNISEELESIKNANDTVEDSDKNEALNAGPIRTVSDIEGEGDGNRGPNGNGATEVRDKWMDVREQKRERSREWLP